jgi:hypothetical protein
MRFSVIIPPAPYHILENMVAAGFGCPTSWAFKIFLLSAARAISADFRFRGFHAAPDENDAGHCFLHFFAVHSSGKKWQKKADRFHGPPAAV